MYGCVDAGAENHSTRREIVWICRSLLSAPIDILSTAQACYYVMIQARAGLLPGVIDETLKRIQMDIEYLNYPEFQNNGTPGNFQKVLVDIDEINYVDEQNKDKEKT